MTSFVLTTLCPLPVYLDESAKRGTLAPRPASLNGKIVGLLPNWRPSAVDILKVIGTLIEERFRPKAIVMEPAVSEPPIKGKLIDATEKQLDDLAKRVDAVIVATGD